MKAIILNSGVGSRLKEYTSEVPKSMVQISDDETIFSKAVTTLLNFNIDEFIITTGYLNNVLNEYALEKFPNTKFKFVHNPEYDTTNYIKSLDYISEEINEDILLLHGDLIFDKEVVEMIINNEKSSMVVNSEIEIPEKDFKAKNVDGLVKKVSVKYFGDDAIACQPLYKLNKEDWKLWKENIRKFCNENNTSVYAEEALNELLGNNTISIEAIDTKGYYCAEIDTVEELLEFRKNYGGN